MNTIKTLGGKDGAKVSLLQQDGKYYLKGNGRRPAPRIHQTSTGKIIGIERPQAPTIPTQELKDLENVPASVAIGTLPGMLDIVESMSSAAAGSIPTTVTVPEDPATLEMVARWLKGC